MIATGRYFKLLRRAFAGHAIDKPMPSGDATRPPSFERVLERLGFAETLEWISCKRGHGGISLPRLEVVLPPLARTLLAVLTVSPTRPGHRAAHPDYGCELEPRWARRGSLP